MVASRRRSGEGATGTANGDDVSGANGNPQGSGVLGWTRSHGRKLATWAAVLFVASLFVPALTKQWNDRQQELEVKQSLLSDLVKETADAVYGAQDISLQQDGQERARMQLLGAWLRRRTALETPLLVYFDESEAADHWRGRNQLGLRNAVLIYVLLACCDPNRARHIGMLRKYLSHVPAPEEVDPWGALRCGPGEGGCTMHASYHVSYRWLGNKLLEQRLVLRDQLLAANGRGFSSGWRDFVGDLNPLG